MYDTQQHMRPASFRCLQLHYSAVWQVSASAYSAAQNYWPSLFAGVSEQRRQQVMTGLRRTRPVLVRGYESMVMVGGPQTQVVAALPHSCWVICLMCQCTFSIHIAACGAGSVAAPPAVQTQVALLGTLLPPGAANCLIAQCWLSMCTQKPTGLYLR